MADDSLRREGNVADSIAPSDYELVRGEDFIAFLVSRLPDAGDWEVTVLEPNLPPEPATRVHCGTWLHAFRMLEPGEVCWNIGPSVARRAGTLLRIRKPNGKKVLLEHPGAWDIIGPNGEARRPDRERPRP